MVSAVSPPTSHDDFNYICEIFSDGCAAGVELKDSL